MLYKKVKPEKKLTFKFDDGRVWKNIPQKDLAGWTHYPFGPLHADVLDHSGKFLGRI